jgi:hypothetical protein
VDTVKKCLKLIMEGTILNESDVVDFTSRHNAQRYEEDIHNFQLQLNKVTIEVREAEDKYDRQKNSGEITTHEFVAKKLALEPKKKLIQYYTRRIGDAKVNLQSLQAHA